MFSFVFNKSPAFFIITKNRVKTGQKGMSVTYDICYFQFCFTSYFYYLNLVNVNINKDDIIHKDKKKDEVL